MRLYTTCAELAGTSEMLDSRYDDLKSGRVKAIPGDEIEAYFREEARPRGFHRQVRFDLAEIWEFIRDGFRKHDI